MSYEKLYRAQALGAAILLFILIIGFNVFGLSVMSLLLCMTYAGLDYNLRKDVHWLEIKENYWSKIGAFFGIVGFIAFCFHGGSILAGLTFAVALVFLLGFILLAVWEYLPLEFTHKH